MVNIYRKKMKSSKIVGVVEKVGSADKRAFQTLEELLSLLSANGGEKRRREERLNLRLPATIEGVSDEGGYFKEKTALEDLSPHGACFTLEHKTDIGAKLARCRARVHRPWKHIESRPGNSPCPVARRRLSAKCCIALCA